jgi:hypothetical protein
MMAHPGRFLARNRRTQCRNSAKLVTEGNLARRTEDTEMNRLALAAATATAPTYAAQIPVLIHQRLKDGVARNKATLTFAEKRVLVLGVGRRTRLAQSQGPTD